MRGENRRGMGAVGTCVCARCGHRQPHRRGVPCLEERCPSCGAALVREGSVRHEAILEKREQKRNA